MRSQFYVDLFDKQGRKHYDVAQRFFSTDLELTSLDQYQMGKFLGQGANALVREAKHQATGHVVAIKVYDKAQLEKNQNIKKSV